VGSLSPEYFGGGGDLFFVGYSGVLSAGNLASPAEDTTKIWFASYNTRLRLSAVALLAAALAGCGHTPIANDTNTPSVSSLTPNEKASNTVHNAATAAAQRPIVKLQSENRSIVKLPSDSYGLASYYEDTLTANGEKYDPNGLTAAHRTLPFGTRVRVTDLASRRCVTVRINDRGPFVPGRVIDVSYAAAKTLGIVDKGVARVELHVINGRAYAAR
jgi:rare lipoprotein A